MNQLEDDLRHSLERIDPPAGFADRVVSRAAAPAGTVVRLAPMRRRSWVLWAGAAAAAVVVVVGAWGFTMRRVEPVAPPNPDVASAPVAPLAPPNTAITSDVAQPIPPDLDVGRGNAGPTGGWSRRVRTSRDASRPAADDPAALAEAQRATEQLRIALNITGSKLSAVRRAAQTKITIPAS